jgi:hypothetical protein
MPEGQPTVRFSSSLCPSLSAVDSAGYGMVRPRRDVSGRRAASSKKLSAAAIAALLR